MKHVLKRGLSLILVCMMVLALLPTAALAAGGPGGNQGGSTGMNETVTIYIDGVETISTVVLLANNKEYTATKNADGSYKVTADIAGANDQLYTDLSVKVNDEAMACTVTTKTVTAGLTYELRAYATHDWNEVSVTKAATCTEAGEMTYTCTRCGEKKTETIPATGHDWGDWTVTKEPTYTETGEKTHTCQNDPSHTETETIPVLAAPTAPGEDDLPGILADLSVEVDCETNDEHDVSNTTASEDDISVDSIGTPTLIDGKYTCTVIISVVPFVPENHELADGEKNTQEITLVYDQSEEKWVLSENTLVTVKVKDSKYAYTVEYYFDNVKGSAPTGASNGDTAEYGKMVSVEPSSPVTVGDDNYVLVSTDHSVQITAGENVIKVYYEKDNWKKDTENGDSETGGDGTPDSQQALIKYESADNGSVTPTVQVETLSETDGAYTGTATISSEATANSGYAFDYWTNSDNTTSYDAQLSGTLSVEGGKEYTYTAHFDTDEKGDSNDPENKGDGIPDKYQVKVTFKVENGSWNDETDADKVIYVTLKDESGNYSTTGSYTLVATDIPAAGNKPADGYVAGSWQVDLKDPKNQVVKEETSYTYSYQKNGSIAYTVEYYFDEVKDDSKTETKYAEFEATINASAPTIDGYVFEKAEPDSIKIAADPTQNVIKLYYAKDAWKDADETDDETDTDGPGSDGIADKYQVVVHYVAGNGGTITGKTVEVFTLKDGDGNYSTSGTVTATGSTAAPNNGYNFSKWTNDAGLPEATNRTLGAQTIENAAGGKGYTFTANFTYAPVVPVNPPVTPVTPVQPSKPTLNLNDHVAYIIGDDKGLVRPMANITRAEVATIFFRLMTDESRTEYWCTTNSFPDVADTAWYNNAVSTLANAGILLGRPDGTFGPQEYITRAEFAAIAARFSDVKYEGGYTFPDVPETHWAYNDIGLAYQLGWVLGQPDGNFAPNRNITRAEAITLINRVLERDVEEEHLLPDMIKWPDNLPGAWYYEAIQEATNSHTYTRTDDQVPSQSFYYEDWYEIIENPDWVALERDWIAASGK